MSASSAHIELRDLTVSFPTRDGELPVLAGLSLDIAWGEFVSIIGPSGCGKTTLLRVIGGLQAPMSGAVRIGGQEPGELQRRKEIGYVFQDPALLPWRKVRDNIRLPLQVNRSAGRTALHDIDELVRLVGLEGFEGYYPHQLSGGMAQRVALARALAFEPSVLLMDEPLAALDEITRSAMRYELLRIWGALKKTVVFVTHSIQEAVLLSDRVVVLGQRPARVRAIVPIDLPRPRGQDIEQSPAFLQHLQRLRGLLE